ncbi:MAG: hypothetical protein JO278_15500, partial [Dyella sp.]|nr:hypothetical protein [Dyella sp.]
AGIAKAGALLAEWISAGIVVDVNHSDDYLAPPANRVEIVHRPVTELA